MSHRHHGVSRFRVVAAVPALGLLAAGLATAGTTSLPAASAEPVSAPSSAAASASDHYINYVEPRVQEDVDQDIRVGQSDEAQKDAVAQAMAVDSKFTQGYPAAARQLARSEARAIKTGRNPADFNAAGFKTAAGEPNEAKLLTILVEFNDQANDDFSDVMVPRTVFEDRTCVPGTVQSGPMHNNIPDPADAEHEDNNSMWVEDFSSDYFNKMLYTDEGITERVRTDLTGPDGKPGIDIAGYTMKNMYEEMSHGAYSVGGEATPWVQVDHSEAWYGANTCSQVLNEETGELEWDAGMPQGMQGHPDNPAGAGQLAVDAINELAASDPNFPWEQYDLEDQADLDGDTIVDEPNGVIDHVVLVHAGEDKSGGGGAQGPYAIWAHSSTVTDDNFTIPGTNGMRISNYIVQPEDSGVGVFAHEYGHDLGLPDLYDTSGAADSDIDFWDLMSSGSHSGPIFQSMPTHMGLWDKFVLGWADPARVQSGDAAQTFEVGQNSRPLEGTEDGVIVELPDKSVTLATPHSGENMWWTGNDQNWADVRLTRSVDVPAGATDAKFWMWNDYTIEKDWDYGFVEVSTDNGATWTEQQVFNEAGQPVTTPADYPDPNGRMGDFANFDSGPDRFGLTGTTGGMQHQYVDLSQFPGQTVQLRLRYATDEAFLERGWFADDFSLTAGGQTVWSDDVEGADNAGWTPEATTFTDTSGSGWRKDSGTHVNEQYYLVEWRNTDGFDEGLKYAYDTTYSRDSWKVEKLQYNAPGMLVSYRDTSFGTEMNVTNHVTAPLSTLPSEGSKGGLLIVDSHFDPLRRTGEAAAADPTTLKNLESRPQSSNAAFGLQPTNPFTECMEFTELDANGDPVVTEPYSEYCSEHGSEAPVRTFTDALGWYPGIEARKGGALFYRDVDASTVVPSRENQPYSTRVVDQDGKPKRSMYGTDLGLATPLGSGNPGDDNVAYGTRIRLVDTTDNNQVAVIEVRPPR